MPKSDWTDPPTNIRARQSERLLELEWADGRLDRVPYRQLRGHCPCAGCVNEMTGERMVGPDAVAEDVGLAGLAPVGGYAVRIVWTDGHSTGLFSWETLRDLGERLDLGRAQSP